MTHNEIELFRKYKSSYASAFIDITIHISCLYFATCLLSYYKNSWFSIFTIFVTGLLLHRTFVVFHDCCHNSYTPSRMLNYCLSSVYGVVTFASPNWVLDHHTHHLTNGNKENAHNFKFNELLYWNKSQFQKFSRISKTIFTFFHTPVVFFSAFPILYFFVLQRFLYIMKKCKYKSKIKRSFIAITINHVINNVGCFLLLFAMYKNGILIHYLIASYIGFLINFLFFFNQHTYNPAYVVGNKEWTQRNSGLLGSSFIQVPRLFKYFTMGIEYHHIHHMNAKIPGYNLKSYHDTLVSQSKLFDNIVKLSMSDCYNNLWLVLYDDETNKYITIAEAEII
jgi:omega-6 fatty acid desaturase (delta-12 desaturase)